jgi:hypothetical protein
VLVVQLAGMVAVAVVVVRQLMGLILVPVVTVQTVKLS